MDVEDPRGALESKPYTWQEHDDEVHIYWQENLVTVLRGKSAFKFLDRITEADSKEAQLIMAKFTGHFKRPK